MCGVASIKAEARARPGATGQPHPQRGQRIDQPRLCRRTGNDSRESKVRDRSRSNRAGADAGWLVGLSEPLVAPGIGRMIGGPDRAWTVVDLAATAVLSRSTFALRSKRVIGEIPLAVVTPWRMTIAADQRRRGDRPISSIDGDVGYDSEAALSKAFSRHFGESPGRFRAA
jgi:AraC-like DNA-binding protein